MNWLVWREYRLNRLILIVALGLLLLPYAIALAAFIWEPHQPNPVEIFAVAALYSLVLIQLTPALLGGNAVAGERSDRSAHFVAYLPISRFRRLVAKLCVTTVATAVLWAINLLVLASFLGFDFDFHTSRSFDNVVSNMLFYSAVTGLLFFGVGWLISSLQSSPTFAVCGALITPLVILMILQAIAWALDQLPNLGEIIAIGYPIVSLPLAAASFTIGTWYYLRRVEP